MKKYMLCALLVLMVFITGCGEWYECGFGKVRFGSVFGDQVSVLASECGVPDERQLIRGHTYLDTFIRTEEIWIYHYNDVTTSKRLTSTYAYITDGRVVNVEIRGAVQ